MTLFNSYKSVQQLKTLSKNPLSLKESTFINNPLRIKEYQVENCGLKYFYGLEKVNQEVMKQLFNLAKESSCLSQMQAMQKGCILNSFENIPSENRQVLHTAARDFFEDRIEDIPAKEASSLAFKEVEKLKKFSSSLNQENKYTDIVQIGIGGSILGPKTMYNALKNFSKDSRKAHFISNIDPDEISSLLKETNLEKTLVICVSKSGTTLETHTNELFLRKEYEKQGLNPKDYFIAITSKGSKMDNKAQYKEVFYIWDYIGGRFSPTSMVGGVLCSLCISFEAYLEFLKGANKMDKAALSDNLQTNLPLILALLSIWNRNFLNYPIHVLSPYSSALSDLCSVVQQYEMESNGKSIDRKAQRVDFSTCPIIFGDIGTNAQHSFFQYLHQGTDISPVFFIGFKKSQNEKDLIIEETTSQQKLLSNIFAQAIALALGKKDDNLNKNFEGDRPSSILIGEKLTPFTLGAIMALFEHKTAFEGFIWNINSFDQEGVQLGKTLANQMMDLFKGKEMSFPLGKAFIDEI